MRYTIGTISSNRTQFNTAIIWLIRVQLSVILPRFECKESWDVLQYDDIFHFGNFPAQYQLSNCQNFKNVSENTILSELQKHCMHIVQVTFQRRCAALLTKRHTFRKVFRSRLHYFKIFRSSLDTWCSHFLGRNFQKFFSIEPYELIFSILSISRVIHYTLFGTWNLGQNHVYVNWGVANYVRFNIIRSLGL